MQDTQYTTTFSHGMLSARAFMAAWILSTLQLGYRLSPQQTAFAPFFFRFPHANIHPLQQLPDGPVDGRSVPHWAGIVHADLHAMVIGKGKIVQRDERLPQRDRGDPAVERAKAPVAAGTYVDDHGAVRQPGVVPAAHVVHLDLRDVLLQIPKQIGDILRAVQAQRTSGGLKNRFAAFLESIPSTSKNRIPPFFRIFFSKTVIQFGNPASAEILRIPGA